MNLNNVLYQVRVLEAMELGDILIRILGILIGLAFLFVGFRMIFRSQSIIQGIQNYKYRQTAPPRKQEIVLARVLGVLLALAGIYFTIAAILSFFPLTPAA
ncbi:MAG: hypothetical protein PHW40_01125 [Candidatus Izemoplasmatales bacterium]|jgi:uncharacterized membrane protein YfcA|nr:hypothetical protein [Candidatus Izemoplasmatales bacterium]MDD5292896.1 hypothetical protein [Candidatus Izemoplasmatales bacterium]